MYAASVYAYFTRVAYVYTWYHGILVTIDSYAVFALRFRVGCRLDVGVKGHRHELCRSTGAIVLTINITMISYDT